MRNVMQELRWLAPEQWNDEEFLQAWTQKYWAVDLDDQLYNDDSANERGEFA